MYQKNCQQTSLVLSIPPVATPRIHQEKRAKICCSEIARILKLTVNIQVPKLGLPHLVSLSLGRVILIAIINCLKELWILKTHLCMFTFWFPSSYQVSYTMANSSSKNPCWECPAEKVFEVVWYHSILTSSLYLVSGTVSCTTFSRCLSYLQNQLMFQTYN